MAIDLPLPEKDDRDKKRDVLNNWIAITIALLASCMGICKIKDDNIVQDMQRAQADKIDHWGWYQALHIREDVAANELNRLRGLPASVPQDRVQGGEVKLEKIIGEKDDMKKKAEEDQKNYDALNYRDDQFDLSDAMLAIAISMLAVASLVQKRWLYLLALIPSAGG